MSPCTTCKFYKAKMCDKWAYVSINPVTGKEKLFGRTDPEGQRKHKGIMAYLMGACGHKGRFHVIRPS